MLLSLGKREAAIDAVELLVECHERIRKFLAMAGKLAAARGVSDDEVRSVAGQVRRYFAESLPLHVADEHEDIAPRLAGAGDEVARALVTIEAEHGAHEPLLARLVALCDVIVADPAQRDAVSSELAAVATQLTDELDRHLALEERVIFPALRRLPASEREAIRTAMRARRSA